MRYVIRVMNFFTLGIGGWSYAAKQCYPDAPTT